jgi:hypothetical protein
MPNLSAFAALSLAALLASTSLVAAGGNQVEPEKITIPAGLGTVPIVPIKIDPIKPQDPVIPNIPIDIHFDPPAKPHLPIKPGLFSKPTPEPKSMMLECMVRDVTPTTDDFWIVNVGEAELPSGLKVRFSVPSTEDSGAFLLPRTVKPGDKLKIAGLLDGAQSGAACRARIL